jgi:ankyrin repeat protein
MTPLVVAARKGNVEAFRLLLDEGANILARSKDGFQCLHHAAFKGQQGILVFTLARIPDVNAESDNGETAIMLAMRNLHIRTIPMLVKKGAHADVKDLADCVKRGEGELKIQQKRGAEAIRTLDEWIAIMPRE